MTYKPYMIADLYSICTCSSKDATTHQVWCSEPILNIHLKTWWLHDDNLAARWLSNCRYINNWRLYDNYPTATRVSNGGRQNLYGHTFIFRPPCSFFHLIKKCPQEKIFLPPDTDGLPFCRVLDSEPWNFTTTRIYNDSLFFLALFYIKTDFWQLCYDVPKITFCLSTRVLQIVQVKMRVYNIYFI